MSITNQAEAMAVFQELDEIRKHPSGAGPPEPLLALNLIAEKTTGAGNHYRVYSLIIWFPIGLEEMKAVVEVAEKNELDVAFREDGVVLQ